MNGRNVRAVSGGGLGLTFGLGRRSLWQSVRLSGTTFLIAAAIVITGLVLLL